MKPEDAMFALDFGNGLQAIKTSAEAGKSCTLTPQQAAAVLRAVDLLRRTHRAGCAMSEYTAKTIKKSRGPALDPHFDVKCPSCGLLERGLDLIDAKRAVRKRAQDLVLGRLS